MQAGLRDLLEKRRNRTIAIILGVKDRECDRHLPPEAQSKLRKVILDQVNEFHDLVLDMMDSLDTGETVLNQLYMDKLTQIHELLVVTNGASR